MTIAIDFDGTCVTNDYPDIGADIGSLPVLRQLLKNGHKLILLTNRTGDELKQAEQWFTDNDIQIWASNKNPEQFRFSRSPKVYADLYIDDLALGCPLISDPDISRRPFADWPAIEAILRERYII
ncbi:MAG: hypothetical protein LUF87_10915 [Alistipes sp.]|nr:hypothetical protein [Alistipes sp.]